MTNPARIAELTANLAAAVAHAGAVVKTGNYGFRIVNAHDDIANGGTVRDVLFAAYAAWDSVYDAAGPMCTDNAETRALRALYAVGETCVAEGVLVG